LCTLGVQRFFRRFEKHPSQINVMGAKTSFSTPSAPRYRTPMTTSSFSISLRTVPCCKCTLPFPDQQITEVYSLRTVKR
jgi:hypothetical protein